MSISPNKICFFNSSWKWSDLVTRAHIPAWQSRIEAAPMNGALPLHFAPSPPLLFVIPQPVFAHLFYFSSPSVQPLCLQCLYHPLSQSPLLERRLSLPPGKITWQHLDDGDNNNVLMFHILHSTPVSIILFNLQNNKHFLGNWSGSRPVAKYRRGKEKYSLVSASPKLTALQERQTTKTAGQYDHRRHPYPAKGGPERQQLAAQGSWKGFTELIFLLHPEGWPGLGNEKGWT